MTILCEHFIFGQFPKGIAFVKSSGTSNLLPLDIMQYLRRLGVQTPEDVVVQNWWSESNILSVTKITLVKDSLGRKSHWNHTILCKISDYLNLTQPSSIFAPYFIGPMEKQPETLEPLKVGEC